MNCPHGLPITMQLTLYDVASRSVVGSFPARAVKAVVWTHDATYAAVVGKRSVTLVDHRMLEVCCCCTL